jgi:hypothetical protein
MQSWRGDTSRARSSMQLLVHVGSVTLWGLLVLGKAGLGNQGEKGVGVGWGKVEWGPSNSINCGHSTHPACQLTPSY